MAPEAKMKEIAAPLHGHDIEEDGPCSEDRFRMTEGDIK